MDSGSGWDERVVLDIEHFRSFTAGDESLEKEVLSMFMGNVPEYIAGLRTVESTEWAAQSHRIKGAARAIGAWNLAVQAERLEKLDDIPEIGTGRRKHLIADLEDRLAAVRDWMLASGIDVD